MWTALSPKPLSGQAGWTTDPEVLGGFRPSFTWGSSLNMFSNCLHCGPLVPRPDTNLCFLDFSVNFLSPPSVAGELAWQTEHSGTPPLIFPSHLFVPFFPYLACFERFNFSDLLFYVAYGGSASHAASHSIQAWRELYSVIHWSVHSNSYCSIFNC